MLILVIIFNTLMQLIDAYSEWYAWTLYAFAILAVVLTLRFQRQLTATMTALILAVPFVLVALGVLAGI